MQPGKLVAGRYVIEALAGAGGMGTVFRARDLASDAPVALKIVRSLDPRTTGRFVREAELLASLEHPSIVRYLAHGPLRADALFLALEWIEGESLHDAMTRRGLSVRHAVRLAHRLAGALAWIHARGVVHGDVKPSNVLLPSGLEDQPKLTDFGIAHRLDDERLGAWRAIAGTPAWMAPEQARRGGGVDPRADVFSLGAVLFACVTGSPPFGDDVGRWDATRAEAPRLRASRPELPQALDALLSSMLARDPADRPSSCAQVESALADLLDLADDAPPRRVGLAPPGDTREGTSELRDGDDLFASHEQRVSCNVIATGVEGDGDRTVAGLAAKHGATIERRSGGSLVAAVRGPGSATDQASRAARLALAVRDAIPTIRVALVTGPIDSERSAPSPELVQRGERLLAGPATSTSPKGLPTDASSAALLEGRFEIDRAGAAPIVRGERAALDAPRLLLGRPTPFVGRARELHGLEAIYRAAIAEGASRVVLITGDAGIGKSRLRHELLARLGSASPTLRTWMGEGDPMRFGTPYSLVAPVIRHVSGIDDRDPVEVRRDKLVARVSRSLPPAEAQDVSEFLGEIAGVPFPADGRPRLIAARQSPLVMARRVREAFRAFLGAELAGGPILLILEDLHWGDLPSLRLVDQMLAAFERAPFLVLSMGRPEVDRLFPEAWTARSPHRLHLSELSPRAAQRLAREVLGERTDPALIERVVRRAEGNAFHLEEVIRAVAEGRTDELPETVVAMAQSRLDALPSDARRVLRACSVFGDDVTREAVAALSGGASAREIALRLDDLVERELLVRRRARGAPRYSFRHALLREGAYATFTAADRARAHRLALEWLRDRGEPLVLAEHAERAGERAVAAEMLLQAAEEALVANDFAAAIARATRGLSHGAEGQLRAALLVVQGQAHAYRNEWTHVVQNDVALELAAPGSAVWCTAAAGLLWARLELGEPPETIAPILMALRVTEPDADASAALSSTLAIVVPLLGWLGQHAVSAGFLERLEEIASRLSPDDLLSRGWLHLARAHQANFERNDTYRAVLDFREAVDLATRGGDRATLRPLSVGALGEALRALGRPEESERMQREILADTARSLEFITSFNRSYLANAQLARGDLAGAAETATAIIAACGPKDRWREGAARAVLALVAEERGELEAAEDEATRSIELLEQVPFSAALGFAARASIRLARGDVARALEDALVAHGVLDAIGTLGSYEARVRLVCARALDAAGDRARATEVLRNAVETLARRRASIGDPSLQRSFEAIPEHVETLALARAWSIVA